MISLPVKNSPMKLFDFLHIQTVGRRFLLLFFDGLLIVFSFYGAIALRLNNPINLNIFLSEQKILLLPAVVSGLAVLWLSGWYRGLTRYTGSYSLYGLIPRSFLMVILLLFLSTRVFMINPPRSYWILYWLLFTASAIAMRIVMRDILLQQIERHNAKSLNGNIEQSDTTLIYGAGSSGLTLLMALRNDPRFKIIGYLDDDTFLHDRTLQNHPIFSPDRIPYLINKYKLKQVLLAMPSVSRKRKRYLVDNLTHHGIKVLSIPSLGQLASGSRIVSDLQNVSIEDLLGRETSNAIPELLKIGVQDKTLLVTGAGGSIGSELCRQITSLGVEKLIILELNEFALYSIRKELANRLHPKQLVTVLGNARDEKLLDQVFEHHKIDTIFHAAAYKHVPLVEENICAGVSNNILSTRAIINAASKCKVERLMLISTDKAVRPTNIMGASKRICELMIQSAAESCRAQGTILSMVRFGNVLGSSGSVIPLFHEQIAKGGPVTVTHPSVTRYFMTIPEAVQLVLQATGMAKGGDVFLLDMGEPVRIADLARQMIELSGLRVRDDMSPDGDISIEFTGLRPGEKLYEELLICADDQATDHPLIRRAQEPKLDRQDFDRLLNQLVTALQQWDAEATYKFIHQLVPELKTKTHF
ncbi:MAG: nucleoside-diphosphate sugar epimerase/dehydratase [Cyanobacteriota bacterium]|nr:nucleoside-diphosphate sugar epimerase/dehydratase [Cyanobacteriota bacterium]